MFREYTTEKKAGKQNCIHNIVSTLLPFEDNIGKNYQKKIS